MIRGNEFLVILLWVLPTALAAGHALSTPQSKWVASDQSQVVWVVVILLVPLFGALLYFLVARPRLDSR